MKNSEPFGSSSPQRGRIETARRASIHRAFRAALGLNGAGIADEVNA
ncbi:hypothetical protein [Solimonas terrae]|uniref:Uncharacterized protein n=1 Tax=Solimonas terrae TaxID=1396819 RepID=A0A6M2BKM8_9GAMM|nr:hypothetical protein [Solimonas terrae]NGY03372.1 hypothetical protein [Solimonas terrae]